jgi:hypothetical protein
VLYTTFFFIQILDLTKTCNSIYSPFNTYSCTNCHMFSHFAWRSFELSACLPQCKVSRPKSHKWGHSSQVDTIIFSSYSSVHLNIRWSKYMCLFLHINSCMSKNIKNNISDHIWNLKTAYNGLCAHHKRLTTPYDK